MDGDLTSAVDELTQRLTRERAALVAAMARGRDVRAGADESGTITIVVDDEGTARDVLVATDWRRRLRPGALGSAVVAADGDAAERRSTALAQALGQTSTQDSPDGTTNLSTEDEGPGWPGWLVPVPPTGPAEGQPRSLLELSAAVWAASEDLSRVTERPPPVQGAGAEGAVTVTMAQGRITECTINQAWLARQDELTLAHALREAVCAAATAGLAARRPLIEYHQRLAALIADAKATLHAIP